MKADLVFWQKARIQERYVLELKIYDVGRSAKYPEGIRYGLICRDLLTGKKVLLDNHHPKGHHLHLDETEFPYKFKGVSTLFEDFAKWVHSQLGVRL